jgi:hypothetical protein
MVTAVKISNLTSDSLPLLDSVTPLLAVSSPTQVTPCGRRANQAKSDRRLFRGRILEIRPNLLICAAFVSHAVLAPRQDKCFLMGNHALVCCHVFVQTVMDGVHCHL